MVRSTIITSSSIKTIKTKVVPRERITKAMRKEMINNKLKQDELIQLSETAPKSVSTILTTANEQISTTNTKNTNNNTKTNNYNLAIRPIGNSRRIFLLNPYLTSSEMDGLAYRITSLTKNDSINSILIATDNRDDSKYNCLPTYAMNIETLPTDDILYDYDPKLNHTWYVSGGYNPLDLYHMSQNDDDNNNTGDSDDAKYLMDSIKKLTLATSGQHKKSKVPVITMPHGAITDSGYSLCLSSYVLATSQTSFKMLNPSRGLSFDPIGYSFILPRLGWEFNQRCKDYTRGCSLILSIMGYEANCYDLVELGLATHLISNSYDLGYLEECLASISPYNQQGLVKKPKHYYGIPKPHDVNAKFRNMQVASTIETFSDYTINKSNDIPIDYADLLNTDPALDIDSEIPWDTTFINSDIVDYAVTFDTIFREEKSLHGIIERFKEISNRITTNEEEQIGINVAKDFIKRIEKQSPLAISIIYELLNIGSGSRATLLNCMDREKNVQLKLMKMSDFQNWSKHVLKHSGGDTTNTNIPTFTGWKHSNVAAVTKDEVQEIIHG